MPTEQKTTLPFESTLTSLAGWLARLPTNERERYTALYSGLEALNAANPKPDFHFKALEKIRDLVFQASDNLASLYLGKPFPLEFGVRKLAKLSAQFHEELARGYHVITQAKGFGRAFDAEERGRIIHSSMCSLNQMLLRLALMYESPSSSTWQRLNAIYRLAEQEGLQRHREEEYPGSPDSEMCSAQDLYLRMLAFRLVSPYRLGPDEIQRVFDLLRQNAGLLSLSRNPAEEGRQADFAVDLGSAIMPSSLAGGQFDSKGEWRYLFLEPLRKMFAALGRSPSDGEGAALSACVLDYIHLRLGGSCDVLPDKRGLGSILVAGYKNLVQMMSNSQGGFKLQSLEEYVLPTSRIESSKTSGTFSASPSASGQMPGTVLGQARASSGLPCRIYPAKIPGFYVIRLPGQELRAGCLTGTFTDDKLNQFGLMRPGRSEKNPDDYCFERLADHVSLVKVSFDANPKKAYTCFFSAMGNGRYSLITEPMRLRGGDGLGVGGYLGLGRMNRYRVAKLLEKAAEFCQFEVVAEIEKP